MTKAKDVFVVGSNKIGWVDNSFTKEFGDDEMTPGIVLKFQKLTKGMSDSEIISELKIQECTLGDVLATINGATDDMRDGYANIFYVKGHSRVVRVYWVDGEWSVRVWDREAWWRAGLRVFSPATENSTLGSGPDSTLTLRDICECPRCEFCKKRLSTN